MADLIGVAYFPNQIKDLQGAYQQMEFHVSSDDPTLKTITLQKGQLYYYCFLSKSPTNNAGDCGEGFKVRAKHSNNTLVQPGKVTAYGNDGYCAYFTHTWGGLPVNEAGWVWVQLSNRSREYLILEKA